MIVCHCNVIACTDIRLSVQRLAAQPEGSVITPGRVFHCCGALPRCGGCMTGVKRVISRELDRLGMAAPELRSNTREVVASDSDATTAAQ